MRISDWSSDVCSSDLASVSIGPELGMGTKADSIDAHVLGAEPSLVRQKSGQDSLFQSFARSTCNEAAPALGKHQGPKLGQGRHVRFVPGRRLGLLSQQEPVERSEEHTSELQSLMRISYAVF